MNELRKQIVFISCDWLIIFILYNAISIKASVIVAFITLIGDIIYELYRHHKEKKNNLQQLNTLLQQYNNYKTNHPIDSTNKPSNTLQ